MYYILFCNVVKDYLEKRTPYREDHLKLAAEASERGELVMAGALSDPADKTVLIFKGESTAVVENFIKNDPYVKNGVVESWEIRPWNVAIGK